MILRRLIYLLALAGCILFFLAYQLWFSWFALVALLCLPLFSLLISLMAMTTARLKMRLPRNLPVGTEQTLDVHCNSLLFPPPWRCKLVVERPLTQEEWVMQEHDPLPTEHCGGLLCSIQKPRIYDYLGLFCKKMKHDPQRAILVRPKPIPMRIPDLDKFSVSSWRPKWGGGFAENHELRLYRPGDNIQQIHWKLSAKTGSLILRQPMEPIRNQVLVRLDLCGSHAELDRKLGRLLWLGNQLLGKDRHFQLHALTGQGLQRWSITDAESLEKVMDTLLLCSPAHAGADGILSEPADWQYYIGGGADEA